MTGGLCTKPPCRPPRAAQVPQWLPLKCRGGLLQATVKYSQTGIRRIRNPPSRQYQQINTGGRVKSSMIDTTYAAVLAALLSEMKSAGGIFSHPLIRVLCASVAVFSLSLAGEGEKYPTSTFEVYLLLTESRSMLLFLQGKTDGHAIWLLV